MWTDSGVATQLSWRLRRLLVCLSITVLGLAACGGITDLPGADTGGLGTGGTTNNGAGGSSQGAGGASAKGGSSGTTAHAGTTGASGATAAGGSTGTAGTASTAGGTGTGASAGVAGSAGSATVTGLTVSPSLSTLGIGTTGGLVATANHSDGSKTDVSAQAVWTSASPAVATVVAGKVTGVSAGTTKVTVMFSGFSASASITVSTASATSLTVDPSTVTLPTGGTKALSATLHLSDGTTQDATTVAMWSSKDPNVANVDQTGLVKGVSAGDTTVTATTAGLSGGSQITVSAAQLTSITLSPSQPTIPVGTSLAFTALGVFSDGTTSDVTALASFGSGNAAVLAVDGKGNAKALSIGTAIATATVGTINGSTSVTVTGASLTGVVVSPATATLAVTHTANFVAKATYSDGTSVDVTSSADWTSSDATIATVGTGAAAGGQVTGIAAGGATITATSSGVSGSATVKIIDAKLVSLAIAPSSFSVPKGGKASLVVTGTYDDGSTTDETNNVTWSSSAETVISIAAGTATGLSEGTATITATLGAITGDASGTVTAAVVTSVVVTPSTLTLAIAKKQNLTLTALFSDGTSLDVTSAATWTSSDAMIATVSDDAASKGLVAAVATGSASISGSYMSLSASCAVTVGAKTLTSLSISPINPSVVVGQNVNFSAVAIFSDGTQQTVTNMAAWTSSDLSVATLTMGGMGMGMGPGGGPGGGERASGVAAGTSTITATYMGFTASTTLTVTAATPVSISVSPVDASFVVGATSPYQAVVILSDGTSQNIPQQCTWTSSDPSVAAITTGMGGPGPGGGMSGQLTAISAGTATITCTFMGLSGSTPVTVTAATITSVVVSPASVTGALGSSQNFSAAAIYSDGTSADVTNQATWQSDNTAAAQVSTSMMGKGQAKAIGAGVAHITATYKGITGSATYTVTGATLMSLVISPANAQTTLGVPVQLTAEAIFSDGTSADVTGATTWQSSDPTIAAVSDSMQRGRVTPITMGTVTITATYQGVSTTTMFTVKGATLVMVQVTPFDPTIPLGFTTPFQATGIYDDNSTLDLTNLATWTSSDTSIASVSASGMTRGTVTPAAAGTTTISAAYQGVTGTSKVTITSAKLVSISIAPNPIALSIGQTLALAATGTFDDGSQLDVTGYVTWLSSATSVANVSNAGATRGHVKGLSAGTANVTATRGAIVAGDAATVN